MRWCNMCKCVVNLFVKNVISVSHIVLALLFETGVVALCWLSDKMQQLQGAYTLASQASTYTVCCYD